MSKNLASFLISLVLIAFTGVFFFREGKKVGVQRNCPQADTVLDNAVHGKGVEDYPISAIRIDKPQPADIEEVVGKDLKKFYDLHKEDFALGNCYFTSTGGTCVGEAADRMWTPKQPVK